MKRPTLDLLSCPNCHSHLLLETPSAGIHIDSGTLACPACRKTYPIQDGIVHFIKQDELVGLNRKFSRMYDWFSYIYAAFSKVGLFFLGTSEARARRELVARLEPRGRVLEVSIGPGVNLPYLLEIPAVDEVYGLDISPGQLNHCNALLRRKRWSVDLFLATAEQLPFTANSFDSVFHVGGINFFSDKQAAIHEMIRVAKPGTRIIICDENEKGAQSYEKFLPGFKRAFRGQREQVIAPIGLIPPAMRDIKLDNIWNGFMYCLQFNKPASDSI